MYNFVLILAKYNRYYLIIIQNIIRFYYYHDTIYYNDVSI